jgi:rhamnose utilization protein RhaD (predicted bifunctional aldolase and dehydrogenase)
MPQTINKTDDFQIIAGVFSDREKADQAIIAFQEAGVPAQNIQFVVQPDKQTTAVTYADDFQERGIAERQAAYYDKAVRDGKTFVAVYNVTNPAPIVEIFDRYSAEYNPDGSRNVRQDVAGMTAGAGAGAVVGAAVGLVAGGPVGAAAGAAAGAVIGGGTGAAAGKGIEHNK